jgi:hypothetical protein
MAPFVESVENHGGIDQPGDQTADEEDEKEVTEGSC